MRDEVLRGVCLAFMGLSEPDWAGLLLGIGIEKQATNLIGEVLKNRERHILIAFSLGYGLI